jgi:hypothetical protein
MGWEKRRGGLYYYHSVRDGKDVRKVYLGTGWMADTFARADQFIRHIREEEAEFWREERNQLEALIAPVFELCEAAEILIQAHLAAAGYRKHKGEWRRARERPSA